MNAYTEFIHRKSQLDGMHGFAPVWMPDFLFPFQVHLVDWAIRKGRAAIFADCGLGKTPMQLVWAENVLRKTGKPVLIIAPLAVAPQTVREGVKFGLEVERSNEGEHKAGIVITNYERLHYFDPADFSGVVCDESSAIKHAQAKRRREITRFLLKREYRLLCTATAAPNDYFELGTSSEALGYMSFSDMLGKFFKQRQSDERKHGWHIPLYRFRGHAAEPFWRWVCSWARACRKPSDLGYEDDGFVLPPLKVREHTVFSGFVPPGELFVRPAVTLRDQRDERRATIQERCEAVAEQVSGVAGSSVSWCHLNAEGKLLAKLIPDAQEVYGSMQVEQKEELLEAFQAGTLKRLVIKPKIGAFGLNWQHCSNVTTFPSHSYEQYYQAVRRCWRFGQTKPVTVEIYTTEGEVRVLDSLQRKADQVDDMFTSLVANMTEATHIANTQYDGSPEEIPSWL